MKKYNLWSLILIIAIIVILFILWVRPSETSKENIDLTKASSTITSIEDKVISSLPKDISIFKSDSQQDTEINCSLTLDRSNHLIVDEQTKNCFEYFITQYGEKDMAQIKNDFETYIKQSYKEPVLSQTLDLWNRYLEYISRLPEAEQSLHVTAKDPQYYRAVFSNLQSLRKQFFSNYEIEGLFGTEDTYNLYTLNRMDIYNNKQLTSQEKTEKLQALFNALPQDWKENLEQLHAVENLQKLTAEIKAREGTPEELRQMRLSLVGQEATTRLENLDVQRENWSSKVDQYLLERDHINQSNMSDSAKNQAIQSLREKNFTDQHEKIRLETFENLHDNGNNSLLN